MFFILNLTLVAKKKKELFKCDDISTVHYYMHFIIIILLSIIIN